MSEENFQILEPNQEIKFSNTEPANTVTQEEEQKKVPGELILKLVIEKEDYVSR